MSSTNASSGFARQNTGIEGEHWAQYAGGRRCREENTLTERQRWGPSNDSGLRMEKLGITIQDLPRVRKTDTFIVLYLFVLYSVKYLKTFHFAACFMSLWTSISVSTLILHVTSSRFCLYLLILITLITHFHTHIQRHTHTSTHVWSAHKGNGDNQAQEPSWKGREKGFWTRQRTSTICIYICIYISAHWYLKS